MSFRRVLGLAILIVGIVVFVFGIKATHKVNEQVVQAVQGRFTDMTMWYILGGIVLIVIGVGMTFVRKKP